MARSERLLLTTSVGLRFWDVATGGPAERPAAVTGRPHRAGGRLGRPSAPIVTPSGVHAFTFPAAGLPADRCRIDVVDPRFVPVGVHTPLNDPAIARPELPADLPPGQAPPAFVPLFPSVARTVGASRAAIRAEVERSGEPARWALVGVSVVGVGVPGVFGIADADGRVLVALPWPEPSMAGPHPADAGRVPLTEQAVSLTGQTGSLTEQVWPLAVTVRSDPAIASSTDPPDLRAVWDQPPVPVTGPPDVVLRYGREAVLRTPGASRLRLG